MESPLSRSRANLNEAIKVLPEVQKAAYLEALKRAPHLVETESNPSCFLQRENFNYWAAAARIVAYWEERKKGFGDRAFLPLTLVGDSALSPEAIRALREGVLLLLPNDSEGRSVVCYDQAKFYELCPDKEDRSADVVQVQIVFYQYFMIMRHSVAYHNSVAPELGHVLLVKKSPTSHSRRAKMASYLHRTAMPVPIHSVHFLTAEPINPILLQCWKWKTGQKLHVHICPTPQDRARKLEPFGFTKYTLPRILGGCWDVVQMDGLQKDECGNWLNGDVPFSTSVEAASGSHESNFSMIRPVPSVILQTKKSSNTKCNISTKASSIMKRSSPAGPKRKRSKLLEINEEDVLFGHKWTMNQGNQELRTLVTLATARYQSAASRKEKKKIRCEILNRVKEKGRFMKFDQALNKWCEVSSGYALEKIGETFQNVKKTC